MINDKISKWAMKKNWSWYWINFKAFRFLNADWFNSCTYIDVGADIVLNFNLFDKSILPNMNELIKIHIYIKILNYKDLFLIGLIKNNLII